MAKKTVITCDGCDKTQPEKIEEWFTRIETACFDVALLRKVEIRHACSPTCEVKVLRRMATAIEVESLAKKEGSASTG